MNRLQKKCLIASAALHVLLGVILLVGPAFFVEIKKPSPALPVLEMIPSKAVDIELYGGGNPTVKSPPAAAPAAPAPPPPAPVTQPPKPVPPAPRNIEPPPKPAPPPENKKVTKPAVEAPKRKVATFKPEPVKSAPKKPEIKVNLDKVVTHPAEDRKEREQARKRREQEQAKAREEYETAVAAQQRRADQIDRSLTKSMRTLADGLSSGTTVEMPGPGGAAFANYAQIIKSIYDKAWLVRDDITNTRATVDVEIVVRRNGTVMSARIVRPSGNPALDKSVREALDRVRSIVPFPEGATEVERHFKLNFNLQTKRLTG